MNYAQIRKMDISNGEGIGMSLFVSGCPFHCKNCFNSIAWDYNYGKPFTDETMNTIIKLLNHDYIKRFSILGGEPLADNNSETVYRILSTIRKTYPDKQIWVYSGYTFEEIMNGVKNTTDLYKIKALNNADVLVDGRYVDELKDLNLHFRGSSNQRLIDLNKSTSDNVVLYEVNA